MNMGQFFILIVMLILVFTGFYLILTMYEKNVAYEDFFYGFKDDNISGIQFYPNMRFRSREISYHIESVCTAEKTDKIKIALSRIEDATILNFYEDSENPEIRYFCSNIAPMPEEETHFIAGEGGPSEIINASSFSVILSGKVSLYRKESCEKPQVATHETLHALGFDHSNNPEGIMYPVTDCDQEIEQYITDKIENLYAIETAPDLVIESTTAEKEGRFLTFKITVSNFGLADSELAKLVVYSDNESVKEFDLNDIKIGVRKVISVENLRLLPETERISFVIETDEKEISKENNAVELVSES